MIENLHSMNLTPSMTTSEVYQAVFTSFVNGIRNVKADAPRKYLAGLKLRHETIGVGFCSGQMHHRKSAEFIEQLIRVGLLTKNDSIAQPHTAFGNYGILFPLRGESGEIVNFYAIRFALETPVHQYINDIGLYPAYPSPITKRLFITGTMIDAATVLEAKVLDNRESVMALLDGELWQQHIDALSACTSLEEIILIGCDVPVATTIIERFPGIAVSEVLLPEGQTLNDVWIRGDQNTVLQLIEGRQFLTDAPRFEAEILPSHDTGGLIRVNPSKLLWRGDIGDFYVQGAISMDLSKLPVMLKIRLKTGQVYMNRHDLYESEQRAVIAKALMEYGTSPHEVEADLMLLVLLLDEFRDERLTPEPSVKGKRREPELSLERERDVVKFLSQQNLLQRIDTLLEEAGIIGEERTRLTVFIIASSYKNPNPLHCIVQGSSGSGKTHVIATIASCIPDDAVLSLTRLTSNSFYYLEDGELSGKLLLLHDLDGLSEESLFALRELQSAKRIANFRPYKDKESGAVKTSNTEIRGSFASLMATTKGTLYYDNLSRSIILGVAEGPEQTKAIVEYQNKKRAGLIDGGKEGAARKWLQDVNRMLVPHEVINPYAHRLHLPVSGMLLRRLNDQFLSFVEHITLLHQYQRERDKEGRLVTTPADIRYAVELFFLPIFLKVDDLDASLRQFFDALKVYVKNHIPDGRFRQREVRHAMQYSRTHVFTFFKELKEREYIRVVGGSANRGFIYEIEYWDDAEKLRSEIKEALLTQVNQLEE